jgi:polar amino acid transport system substrate-binding protein
MLTFAFCGCFSGSGVSSEDEDNLPQLVIGIDAEYEPYSYIDESGNYAGLDIELAKEACRRMNIKPVFKAIKWNYKDTYLAEGMIDCVWSCFSMNGREDEYNWVGPYMYSRQVVAVGIDSDIKDFEDLRGKTVAVMSSTKPESVFLKKEYDDVPEVANVYSMEDMQLVFSALQLGYVDAAAGHETVMRQYMETTPGDYRLLDEDLLSARVGVAFEKDEDTQTAAKLTAVLDDMKKDGTLEKTLGEYGIEEKNNVGGEIQ